MLRTYIVLIIAFGLLFAAVSAPIFAQPASGSNFSALHSFVGADGETPHGLIEGIDGNFYGTTSGGGVAGYGTFFMITPSGSLTTLHSFSNGADGAYPAAILALGPGGSFYGTTAGSTSINGAATGPCPYGTVFKVTPSGSVTTLYSFQSAGDGEDPLNGVILGTDGNYYGTTECAPYSYDAGTVFKITPSGALKTLYTFDGGTDGYFPSGLVQGPNGCFYGTTHDGGARGYGSFFQITAAGAHTVLYSFDPFNGDGIYPDSRVVLGGDGNFYGTAPKGGNYWVGTNNSDTGYGTVYKVTAVGVETILYSFSGADGYSPSGGLIQGSDGNFYGVTQSGGSSYNPSNSEYGHGTVFKMTPSGSLDTLYSFTDGSDGAAPETSLVQGSDGSFYGTTVSGGNLTVNQGYGYGTVFKLTSSTASTYSTYVLWSNSGTASLWNIPVSGSPATASFGPFSGWTPTALSSDTSGNAYILWTSTTGAACVWQVSPSLKVTASQSFGPFTGWTAKTLTVGPAGNVHLLWNHAADNQASIFNIALGSSFTSQAYGPYAGWQATQIAVDSSNNTRLLWNNTSTSAAALWNITSGGAVTSQSFGPFAGYKAQCLVAGPANLPRLIWDYTSTNAASLWLMLPLGNETSTVLGPIAGCTPTGLAVNGDGDSDVLWTNSLTGQATIWDVTSTGTHTSTTYGPYSGWKAIAIAPGP